MARTAGQITNEGAEPPTTPPVSGSANPPVEDITPRDTLPSMAQLHMPVKKPKAGWQTDPLPKSEFEIPCPHVGRTVASFQAKRYPLGAEWVCTCGQIFVVAINAGGKKTLRSQDDVEEVEPPEEVELPEVEVD